MKVDGMDSEAHERLEEESQCSQHTHGHKNPEENPVDDHGDVFPVILHLWRRERMDVVGKIPRSVTPSKRDDISKPQHTPVISGRAFLCVQVLTIAALTLMPL